MGPSLLASSAVLAAHSTKGEKLATATLSSHDEEPFTNDVRCESGRFGVGCGFPISNQWKGDLEDLLVTGGRGLKDQKRHL